MGICDSLVGNSKAASELMVKHGFYPPNNDVKRTVFEIHPTHLKNNKITTIRFRCIVLIFNEQAGKLQAAALRVSRISKQIEIRILPV